MKTTLLHRLLHKTCGLALLLLSLASIPALATTVRMQTSLGAIDIQLMDASAPETVANFLNYVRSGAYVDSFIHRSMPGFIVQGGGYRWSSASNRYSTVSTHAPMIDGSASVAPI